MASLPVVSPDTSTLTNVSAAAAKVPILGTDPANFDREVAGWGWPRFRGKQVRDWVFTKLADDPDRMTNLSKQDRDLLRERVEVATSEITRRQSSTDGTEKLLLTWSSQGKAASAETVMIPDA